MAIGCAVGSLGCVFEDVGQGSVGINSQVSVFNGLARILDGNPSLYCDGIKPLD